jgi:hypothetical protein
MIALYNYPYDGGTSIFVEERENFFELSSVGELKCRDDAVKLGQLDDHKLDSNWCQS